MYFIDPVPVIKEKAPIKKGDMVRWNSSGGPAYGKVVHIMKDGVLGVPDSKFKINAKPDDPAVLIQIYKGAKETEVFVGHKMSTLKLASMRKEADITKAQPDMGEVHVDAPLGSKKKPKMVNGYEIYVDEEMLAKASMQFMPLINSLKQWLSDLTAFYLKAHGYHWNVEGENFSEYHELFGEIYSSAYNEVDPTGEYIRVYDAYAPSDMNIFLALSQIKSKPLASTDAIGMAQDLYDANKILLMDLKDVFNNGSSNNEQGLLNFIAAVIQEHQKWDWQLRSSIKDVEETEVAPVNENIGMNAEGMNMENDMFKHAMHDQSSHGSWAGNGGAGSSGGGSSSGKFKRDSQKRPISEVANEIVNDPNYRKMPSKIYADAYVQPMRSMNDIEDNYFADTGVSIVSYALSNLSSYRGDTARRVKSELKDMLKPNKGKSNNFIAQRSSMDEPTYIGNEGKSFDSGNGRFI